ncbi:MAG: redoxin domain-containing protein, partial [Chromatiales bacterium]|nr:redoxin domain-containing protein [Chromatiales bacterium]
GRPLDVRAPGGESVLVHFWATWCHICPLMDGNIEWLADGHRVIGVALRSGGAASVANYMRDEDIAFPTLLDPDGYEAARWGVRGVPATFFVSGDGTVTHVSVGYTSWLGLRIRLWLAGRQTD